MRNVLCLVMALGLSQQASADVDTARRMIDGLLDGFHDAATRADFDNYFDRFSDDAYFLGTDAAERWSVSAFREYAKPRFEQGGGWRYQVQTRNVEFGPDGKTAWFDEILFNAALGRCRGAGVLIVEKGQWKIAYYSLTLLIPNAIADEVGRRSMQAEGLLP